MCFLHQGERLNITLFDRMLAKYLSIGFLNPVLKENLKSQSSFAPLLNKTVFMCSLNIELHKRGLLRVFLPVWWRRSGSIQSSSPWIRSKHNERGSSGTFMRGFCSSQATSFFSLCHPTLSVPMGLLQIKRFICFFDLPNFWIVCTTFIKKAFKSVYITICSCCLSFPS